ncbi:hypothetical protein ALP65_02729 [Pseudomonas aeruginosa]|uniref:ABC transporter domain-containing protein n=1 Tax=Pseudomonas aeruginosa TaxID=287 RepID=A0A3M5E1B7_PSEAI|nr:hypothetical protein ALP65_02729 [Pseudomonas aeruginosa]
MILRLHEVARSHGAGRQRYRLRVPALELRAGRQLAIVGPSGCGKSTLLDLLALALAPDPGGRFEFLAGERPQDIAALWRDRLQARRKVGSAFSRSRTVPSTQRSSRRIRPSRSSARISSWVGNGGSPLAAVTLSRVSR